MEEIKPFLPIIMGASGGLVLIGLLIIIIVRMRSSGGQDRNMNTVNNTCANHTPTNNNLSNGKDALLFHFITSRSESEGHGQRKNMLHILLPKINKTEIIWWTFNETKPNPTHGEHKEVVVIEIDALAQYSARTSEGIINHLRFFHQITETQLFHIPSSRQWREHGEESGHHSTRYGRQYLFTPLPLPSSGAKIRWPSNKPTIMMTRLHCRTQRRWARGQQWTGRQ